MKQPLALPVDAILPAMLASLERVPNIVIEAPPGAGKTTRVPPAILSTVRGEVIVLEPRRIAARMAARRVAAERGEEVGSTVGYQVRFEERAGPQTRLRFVTEGILTRRFLSDPMLKGVDAVVLDEFHERHLEGDLALALLKRLQRQRPELRLVVMSATLDAAPIAQYLGGCPVLRSEGRMYPLTVRHLAHSAAPLQVQVRNAVELLQAEGHVGNILTFLPGTAEIRRAMRECEVVARRYGLLVLPLHGDLTPAEQDRAVMPSSERKLILATNVAESSVTVEGVTAVIDSGLARQATYSPWTGLPTLEIGRISKAFATQRAGRAGRMGPGQVLRLYPEEDFLLRLEHDLPEIQRTDLSQLLLSLRAMDVGELEWLDAPPVASVQSAEALLDRLGARGEMALRLSRFPLPPRLARVVVEAMVRGVGEDGCRVAAMLGSRAPREKNDLLAALDVAPDAAMREATAQLVRVVRALLRPTSQNRDMGHPDSRRHPAQKLDVGDQDSCRRDETLLLSVLAGFPDRVGRRRAGNRVMLASGVSVELAGEVPGYEFLVALDAEDRKDNPLPLVRMVARVEPEWLLELFPERVTEQVRVVWNRGSERVERVSSLLYYTLVLEETRGNAAEPEAAEMLARVAMEMGIAPFVDRELLEQFTMRVAFAGMERVDVEACVRELCVGSHSLADLRTASGSLLPLLEQQVNVRLLNELAPVSVRLPTGRQTKVHYESDRPPWIASRLQDFFGMQTTPVIGPRRLPLVVHLLAPNQRAVQTTTDLSGFWERLYPQVRRELMRRYPRHAWPESPVKQ